VGKNDVSENAFRVIDPYNSSLEFGGERIDRTKGAFSDEARDALALAVSKRKKTVVMDKWTMSITYRDKYVIIKNIRDNGLPCGNMNIEALLDRLKVPEAS